jgi:hypothetical protein
MEHELDKPHPGRYPGLVQRNRQSNNIGSGHPTNIRIFGDSRKVETQTKQAAAIQEYEHDTFFATETY